jgi:hypothetical protein
MNKKGPNEFIGLKKYDCPIYGKDIPAGIRPIQIVTFFFLQNGSYCCGHIKKGYTSIGPFLYL